MSNPIKKIKFLKNIIKYTLIFSCIFPLTEAFAENNVTRLENGLRVLVMEDSRFPLVSVRLYVEAGGAYEEAEKAGLSHLLEHMVFRGTEKRPDGSLAKEIESVGGDFNAYTSADETVYYCNLPSSEWKRGVDVVADMALNPVLDPEILEEEKKVVYAEMGQRRESPQMRLYENTVSLALENTPYMHGVLGTKETVADITVEDIQEHMRKYYNPQNMLLVVVGDVKKDEVVAEAKKYFTKNNQTSSVFPSALEVPILQEARFSIDSAPIEKVMINLAFTTPSLLSAQSKDLDVLALMLGGLDTSVLRKKFEYDEKLVNTIYSYNISYNRASLFIISVDVDVDKVKTFWEKFIQELADLSIDDFNINQLDTTKNLYEISFQRRKSTIENYAAFLGDLEFETPGEFAQENYLHAINQININSIENALKKWINPYTVAVSVLAPDSAIKENKLPDFMAILTKDWIEKLDKEAEKEKITPLLNATQLLDNSVKILENTEKRIVLEYASGSKVILLPDNTMPFLVAELRFNGGNRLLKTNEQGLSSALSSILPEATTTMSAEKFSEYLSQRAISISASVSRENFILVLDSPTKYEDEAFAQFKEVLTNPAFNEKDWERQRANILAGLRDSQKRADSVIFTELYPTIFKNSPYGYKTSGTLENVEKFTLKDIKNLWEKQKNESWILTVAGDFNDKIVLEFANSLPLNKRSFKALPKPTLTEEQQKTIVMPEANHDYIIQMFPTVPYSHEDATTLNVLFGALGDMSGILFTEIRDKQALAYSVAPIGMFAPSVGTLGFYVNTAPANREKILPAFNEVIKDLKENSITQERLDAVKKSIQNDYIKSQQALLARASEAGTNAYLNRSLDYQQDFINKSLAVTLDDIQRVAKKYLIPENAYILQVLSDNKK